MDYKRLVILIFLFYFCCPLITYGCRYTIREIGYANIGSPPQTLYLFTDSNTPEKEIATIQKLSTALLNETNVIAEIVRVDEVNPDRLTELMAGYNIKAFPSAILQFPKGDHMIFPLNRPGKSLQESLWMLLENLSGSAMRSAIKKKLVDAYCVILFVEGKERQQNNQILREIKEAVSEISMTFDQMPKEVDAAPELLLLPQKSIADERLLLMSLGITELESEEPAVAILYGRGRIMGPALTGELINRDRILNLLTIVGADCECGLDHSWILGRMIPMRWESGIQSDIARSLGIDVENPLVKAEMTQILSLKPTPNDLLDPMGSNLLGYSEGKLDIVKSPDRVSKISATMVRRSFFQEKASKNNLVVKVLFMGVGLVLLIVIAVFLLIRYQRRRT